MWVKYYKSRSSKSSTLSMAQSSIKKQEQGLVTSRLMQTSTKCIDDAGIPFLRIELLFGYNYIG